MMNNHITIPLVILPLVFYVRQGSRKLPNCKAGPVQLLRRSYRSSWKFRGVQNFHCCCVCVLRCVYYCCVYWWIVFIYLFNVSIDISWKINCVQCDDVCLLKKLTRVCIDIVCGFIYYNVLTLCTKHTNFHIYMNSCNTLYYWTLYSQRSNNNNNVPSFTLLRKCTLPLGYKSVFIFFLSQSHLSLRMDCKVSFLAFCNLCEHLSRLHKVEQKKQKLCGFIAEWRKEDPLTIYSFIRLLLPHVRASVSE